MYLQCIKAIKYLNVNKMKGINLDNKAISGKF